MVSQVCQWPMSVTNKNLNIHSRMNTEDTEALGRYRAKPSKIKKDDRDVKLINGTLFHTFIICSVKTL